MGARTLFIFCILASLATGILNPGPGAIPIQKASLEPKGWIVHFEVDAKNAAGQTSSLATSKISACTIARSSGPGATTT